MAATVISTINSTHAGFTDASWNKWVGQAFEIVSGINPGPTPGALVTSVSIPLIVYEPNANFVVRVVGSMPNSPNIPNMEDIRAVLTSSASQVQNTTVQVINFAPKPGEPVNPLGLENRFWVILGVTEPDSEQTNSAGRYGWSYTDTMASAPAVGDGAAILNVGAESSTAGAGWAVFTQSPQRVSITLVAVPEPGVISLLLMTSGLMFRRSRSPR